MFTSLTVGADGAVSLPWAVLWALSLNEGDLVAALFEEEEPFRLLFRSYGRRVRGAVESCGHPWPYVEEFLCLELAAVGPAGTLGLGNRFKPGESLLLRAESEGIEPWFRLQRAAGQQLTPELYAEAIYFLPVEPGLQVVLPEDALRALSLAGGSAGPGRVVPVPEPARVNPGSRMRLRVTVSGQSASFRLEPEAAV